jgi:hypothetical protein
MHEEYMEDVFVCDRQVCMPMEKNHETMSVNHVKSDDFPTR